MTEEASEDQVPPKPKIRVKRADGAWEELPESLPLSDDPAVNAIGKLTVGEFRKVLKDENHPDHDAAVEYDRLRSEHMQPFFESLAQGVRLPPGTAAGIAESLAKSIELPNFTELIAQGLKLPNPAESIGRRYLELVDAALPMFPTSSLIEIPKFGQVSRQDEPLAVQARKPVELELPDEADVVEVPTWTDAVVSLLSDNLKIHQESFAADRAEAVAARADAKNARDDSKKANTASKNANKLALAALIVAFLSLLAAVVMPVIMS